MKSLPAERQKKEFLKAEAVESSRKNGQDLNRGLCGEGMGESNLGRRVGTIKGMKTRKGSVWEEWQVV